MLIAAQLAAFWPVGRWYCIRMLDSSDEPWGVVALATALVFLLFHKRRHTITAKNLVAPTLFIAVYAVGYGFIPPIFRAGLAVIALTFTLSSFCFGRRLHLGLLGLLLLSLPVISSLQFYLGYPLRLLVGRLAAPLLEMNGLDVHSAGTCLTWNGSLISIDAPCSGIKMLWVGMFVCFTLICFYDMNFKQTFLTALFSFLVLIIGNVFRTAALFYVESGILHLPAWTHAGIGVISFMVAATFILMFAIKVREVDRCVQLQPT
jgi:exosortase/archaeosortase family protein